MKFLIRGRNTRERKRKVAEILQIFDFSMKKFVRMSAGVLGLREGSYRSMNIFEDARCTYTNDLTNTHLYTWFRKRCLHYPLPKVCDFDTPYSLKIYLKRREKKKI